VRASVVGVSRVGLSPGRISVGRVSLTGVVVLALSASCAPPRREVAPGAGFVAVARDFEDFRDWPFLELSPTSLTASHPSAPRRLFFNAVPEDDAAPFPVGAILVKAVIEGDPTTWEIHAMVKRGGEYNADGAVGWEFFDLAIDASDEVIVRWRGEGPPPGAAGYPGSTTGEGACNSCHGLFPDRDYVFDRSLF
jgi:hypothetical protein